MDRRTIRVITIIVCLMILSTGGWNAIMLSSVGEGYTTAYEGAKASYWGIQYKTQTEDGKWISGTRTFTLKGTTFHFDADEYKFPNKYACNLEGEMTSVFLPEHTLSIPTGILYWIPDTLTKNQYILNPINR